jgi:Fur family ferric uptake transcriptional regulator
VTPLEQLCLQRGLRLTEHRRIVLAVLQAAGDHPTAREIHRRASADHRIGLATVYRTLNTLMAAGVVARHVFPDGKARYEGAAVRSHHHLVDIRTGKIFDVRDADIARLVETVARDLGYRLVDYRLRLFAEAQPPQR